MSPRNKKQEVYKFRKIMHNIKKALMEKIDFERDRMLEFWQEHIFDGTPVTFLNDITQWMKEIVAEINETFHHLKEEINETVGQYFQSDRSFLNHDSMTILKNAVIYSTKASECIENDQVILISKGTKYKIPKKTISQEMKSLLHYIEWRHENSYAMVVCKTNKIADDIKRIMDKKDFSYYNDIKIEWKYSKAMFDLPAQYFSKVVCKTTKDKKGFLHYSEIKSKQIPQQEAYVPLFDVESFTSKLEVEPAEYTPSKIKKCNHYENENECEYSCLSHSALWDHQHMYHCSRQYHDDTELRARIVEHKKNLDPEYLGLFDFKSLRYCDDCGLNSCCCGEHDYVCPMHTEYCSIPHCLMSRKLKKEGPQFNYDIKWLLQ